MTAILTGAAGSAARGSTPGAVGADCDDPAVDETTSPCGTGADRLGGVGRGPEPSERLRVVIVLGFATTDVRRLTVEGFSQRTSCIQRMYNSICGRAIESARPPVNRASCQTR
jgi:hypothetical protein